LNVCDIFTFSHCSYKTSPRGGTPDMQCKDTFVIQLVSARPGKIMKDITPEMVTTNNKLLHDIV